MIWKTINALGQKVVWYSEDEIKKYKTMLKAFKEQYGWHDEVKNVENS